MDEFAAKRMDITLSWLEADQAGIKTSPLPCLSSLSLHMPPGGDTQVLSSLIFVQENKKEKMCL